MSVKQQSIESSINAAAMVKLLRVMDGAEAGDGKDLRSDVHDRPEDKGLRRLVEGRGREDSRGPLGVSPLRDALGRFRLSLWTPSSSSRRKNSTAPHKVGSSPSLRRSVYATRSLSLRMRRRRNRRSRWTPPPCRRLMVCIYNIDHRT